MNLLTKSTEESVRSKWYLTLFVIISFLVLLLSLFISIIKQIPISSQIKELLLLITGGLLTFYGNLIVFWFYSHRTVEDVKLKLELSPEMRRLFDLYPTGKKIDVDGDGEYDGFDINNDGIIDVYFEHRNCKHILEEKNGVMECRKCGKIKDNE